MNRSNTNQFVVDAKRVHGNRYDYSQVIYEDAKKKVAIVCVIHGVFTQRPNDHKNGNGCPRCLIKRKKTTEQFVAEAQIVHGSTYNYSKVVYTTTHNKVDIVCATHGTFSQRPMDHLHKNGCPNCARRGYIPAKGGWLYYIKFHTDTDVVFFKIGITNGSVEKRISRLGLNKNTIPSIVWQMWFDDGHVPPLIERNILNKHKNMQLINAHNHMRNGFSETFSRDVLHLLSVDTIIATFSTTQDK